MVNDVRSLEAERGWGGGGHGPVLRRCSEVGWLSSGRERVGVRRRRGPLEAFCGYARQRLRSAASWLLLSVLPGGGGQVLLAASCRRACRMARHPHVSDKGRTR